MSEYTPGEVVAIDGVQFIADKDGELHRMTKKQTRPKPKWEDNEVIEIPYENGRYDVAEVVDEVNDFSIYTIRQWILDEDGNSKIKNKKTGKPYPKKAISLSGNLDTIKGIGNALLKFAEDNEE